MPDSSMVERKLLSSVLADMTYFSELVRIVKPEFFSSEKNRKVWETIVDMYNKHEEVDMTTIFPKVDSKHFAEEIVGTEAVYGQGVIQLGASLCELHIKRQAYFSGVEVLQEVVNGTSVDSIIGKFSSFTKQMESTFDNGAEHNAMEVCNRLADNIQSGRMARVSTPFQTLNYALYGGFGGGQLVILAARPSVGKTTIALQMAQHASRNGVATHYCSLEMTDEELVQRLIVGTGLVSTLELVSGNVNWENYERATEIAINKNLLINDRAKSLDEICTNITLAVQRGKCKIAFIDYLGLIRHYDRGKTQAQIIGDITHRLKGVAMECRIPVVLLCQLNRESAKENRPPVLTDLRDSGDIEQDADVVLMLERPRDEMGTTIDDRIDMWVRKNRTGKCTFDEAYHLQGNDSYSDFREIVNTIPIHV